MPKVLARQCPFTKKLFQVTHKKRYFKHLMEVRDQQRSNRKKKRIHDEFVELRDEISTMTNINDMLRHFIDNQDIFWRRCYQMNGHIVTTVKPIHKMKFPVIKAINITNLTWTRKMRVTHTSPRGHKSDWHGKRDDKHGGWVGRIRLIFDVDQPSDFCSGTSLFSSSVLSELGFNTGSGGGGNGTLAYEMLLYLKDFTGLQEVCREHDIEISNIRRRDREKWKKEMRVWRKDMESYKRVHMMERITDPNTRYNPPRKPSQRVQRFDPIPDGKSIQQRKDEATVSPNTSHESYRIHSVFRDGMPMFSSNKAVAVLYLAKEDEAELAKRRERRRQDLEWNRVIAERQAERQAQREREEREAKEAEDKK